MRNDRRSPDQWVILDPPPPPLGLKWRLTFEEQMSQSRNVNIYKDFDQDDMNVGSEIVHIQNFALF